MRCLRTSLILRLPWMMRWNVFADLQKEKTMRPWSSLNPFESNNLIFPRLIHYMFHQMSQLGKNQFPAGKLAGIQAARHAKHNGIFDHPGRGAR